MKDPEYTPESKNVWLVFDLSNGHKPVKRYVWWFDTREEARKHIRHQKTYPNGADLSNPVKYILSESISSKSVKVKKTKAEKIWSDKDSTIKINGLSFYCECGCNVFRKYNQDKSYYKCNSCEAIYRSE